MKNKSAAPYNNERQGVPEEVKCDLYLSENRNCRHYSDMTPCKKDFYRLCPYYQLELSIRKNTKPDSIADRVQTGLNKRKFYKGR